MVDTANTVFRDFVTDGVPASGAHAPVKADIRELLTSYQSQITAIAGYSVKTVSATSYTILLADNGLILDFTAATAVTVTVPSGLGADFHCGISQGGLGQVTVYGGVGTTLVEADSNFSTEARYIILALVAFAANTFRLLGRTI